MSEVAVYFILLIAIAALGFSAIVIFNLRRTIEDLRGEFDRSVSVLGPELRTEIRTSREEEDGRNARLRTEITSLFTNLNESVTKSLEGIAFSQHNRLIEVSKQLESLTNKTHEDLGKIQAELQHQVNSLRESNEKKLDEMRKTVDEQLQGTLEKRLGESFRLVSQHLEAVQRGLGEMQNLATDVGKLQHALTNVKVRGTWGEVQLGGILEQILAPSQYAANVRIKPNSNEVVEFAVKLPGRNNNDRECIWLPIDSKFPQEDYLRLQEAAELGNADAVNTATQQLAASIRNSAKDISEKYIAPPHSTDFAIMFLPTEGLYSEVLRYPGLADQIRLNHNVIIAGPTTFSAILCSLSFGFQTLAIEQRASEVWKLLSAVKTEFAKFGQVIDSVKKQLEIASRKIDETDRHTRVIQQKLENVEELTSNDMEETLILGTIENKENNLL